MTKICREAEASLDYYAMFKNILKQVRSGLAIWGDLKRACSALTTFATPRSSTRARSEESVVRAAAQKMTCVEASRGGGGLARLVDGAGT